MAYLGSGSTSSSLMPLVVDGGGVWASDGGGDASRRQALTLDR